MKGGRRVALLLAGVLPLLAENDIPTYPEGPENISIIPAASAGDEHDDDGDADEPLRRKRALHYKEDNNKGIPRALPTFLPLELLPHDSRTVDLIETIVLDDVENQQCFLDLYNISSLTGE
jgi:hypothetical protein